MQLRERMEKTAHGPKERKQAEEFQQTHLHLRTPASQCVGSAGVVCVARDEHCLDNSIVGAETRDSRHIPERLIARLFQAIEGLAAARIRRRGSRSPKLQ